MDSNSETQSHIIITTKDVTPISDSKAINLRDVNVETVSRIATWALTNPDQNTDLGHAYKRRYGVRQMLTFLSTLDADAPVELETQTVGLLFNNETKAKPENLHNVNQEQLFLRKHADENAFVTNRLVGKVKLENMTLSLPAWITAVNQNHYQ